MADKNYGDDNFSFGEQSQEHKEGVGKLHLSKYDYELFDDSKAVPAPVIRVKRVGSSKNERWRIFENSDLKFIVEGSKLLKKECAFLRTLEGTSWLISEFKVGFKSLNELKTRLKNKI